MKQTRGFSRVFPGFCVRPTGSLQFVREGTGAFFSFRSLITDRDSPPAVHSNLQITGRWEGETGIWLKHSSPADSALLKYPTYWRFRKNSPRRGRRQIGEVNQELGGAVVYGASVIRLVCEKREAVFSNNIAGNTRSLSDVLLAQAGYEGDNNTEEPYYMEKANVLLMHRVLIQNHSNAKQGEIRTSQTFRGTPGLPRCYFPPPPEYLGPLLGVCFHHQQMILLLTNPRI
mgnify:CR=1 FL=1